MKEIDARAGEVRMLQKELFNSRYKCAGFCVIDARAGEVRMLQKELFNFRYKCAGFCVKEVEERWVSSGSCRKGSR